MSVIVLLGCYYWYITHLVLPDSFFFYKYCHLDIKFNHHRTCAQSQNHGTYKTEIQYNI